jgi:hypothetical protein
VEDDTGLESSWKLVLKWLKDCEECHDKCSPVESGNPWYPTRLLDVGEEDTSLVKLIVTTNSRIRGPYLTLSHRWGKGDMYKLMTAELQSFQDGISPAKFPRTFKDAMTVTKRLGFRYIWIDSLCILQDSVEDWQIESSQMQKVYANGYLNIAATAATGPEDGLFQHRERDQAWPLYVSTAADHRVSLAYDASMVEEELERVELNNRAWTLQERLLAPRVLHFGRRQLFWECQAQQACEMFPQQIPISCLRYNNVFRCGKSLEPAIFMDRIARLGGIVPEDPAQFPYEMWRHVVPRYMGCSLTMAKDKLVAIGGVAKHISNMIHDEYAAGHWRSSIPGSLLWMTLRHQQADKAPSYRPQPYRAPSWSWASLEAEITWSGVDGPSRVYSKAEQLVDIHEVSINPVAGDDEFGQLTGGLIRLSGRLLTPLRVDQGPKFYEVVNEASKPDWPPPNTWISWIKPDVPNASGPVDVSCLPLFNVDYHGPDHLYKECLLLTPRPDRGPNVFKRYGEACFKNHGFKMFDFTEGVEMRSLLGCDVLDTELVLI